MDRAELVAAVAAARAAVDRVETDALEAVDEREATIAALRTEVTRLEADLDECLGEPTPEPEPEPQPEPNPGADPVPTGTFYRGDPMTVAAMNYEGPPWGQWSREGREPGTNGTGTITFRDDGPLDRNCRRISKPASDRRNEIGQVNDDDGFVFAVGGRYVTRVWYRLRTDLDWEKAPDHRGGIMQMKHSSKAAHGGAGGSPSSPAPPIGIKQFGTPGAARIEIVERSGDYAAKPFWSAAVGSGWFEVALDVTYALAGRVAVYFRPTEDQPMRGPVFAGNMPTLKKNTQGRAMFSTLRVGAYDESWMARHVDVGPVRVDRLG
jgi:hypothetical protein